MIYIPIQSGDCSIFRESYIADILIHGDAEGTIDLQLMRSNIFFGYNNFTLW